MSELLCKDCKHSFRPLKSFWYWGSGAEWLCRKAYKEAHIEPDPVRGPKQVPGEYQRCMTARGSWSTAVCGEEGRLWEPKSKKFLFLQIKHSERI